MLKKQALLCVVMSLLAASSVAQNGQGRGRLGPMSTIAVTIDGLSCANGQGTIPALTWSFGASMVTSGTSGSGGSAGKASLSDVSITRRADGCSPTLFEDVVTGRRISKVTIVQQDTAKDDVFTVTLQNVMISSFKLGGDHASEMPTEQVSFSYDKICVADTGAGSKACWDLATGRTF